MDTTRDHEPETTPAEPETAPGWRARTRLLAWAAIAIVLLAAIFLGSVSTVSYRYNSFSTRLTRDVRSSTFLEVWTEQVENLPDTPVQWAMTAAFAGSALLVLAGVVYGARLLLVSSQSREHGLAARPTRRNPDR